MANKNNDFGFEEISINAIKVIDSIRSRGRFGNIIPGESRINAFYRALGLPSVIKPQDDPDPRTNRKPEPRDPNNVSNTFPNDQLKFENFKTQLERRESAVLEEVSRQTKDDFLYFNNSKVSNGIKEGSGARQKGSLKPFVVFGDIEIFPQNRRVGNAFSSEKKLTINSVKYKRPLIETIILMKLKGLGANNSVSQQQVLPETNSLLGSLLDITEKRLLDAISSIPDLIHEAARTVQQSSIETKQIVEPERIPEQHPRTRLRDDEENDLGTLDKISLKQREREILNESIVSLFEFDDTFGDGVNNIKAGLLSSEVLLGTATITRSGSQEINSEEVEFREEKAKKDLKQAYKTLELSLGTFSGISGVDILVVIIALIRLDINNLIGLLNNDAKEALSEIKGKQITSSASDVQTALSELEKEVTSIFEELDAQIEEPNYEKQIVNQKPRS